MNYILKEEALPLSQNYNRNNTVSHHFYQFQEKQKRAKDYQQQQNIENFLKLIQQEQAKMQQKQRKRQAYNKNANFNYNRNTRTSKHSGQYLDSSNHLLKNFTSQERSQNKRNTSLQKLKQKSFYQYNLKWKQKVQSQILKQKQQKLKRQQQQDKKNLKSYLQIDKDNNDKQNYWKQKKLLKDQYQVSSKGPITGWYERFQHYVESRLPQENQQDGNLFCPQINQKSKTIASKMVGKVQDRLIKFGQIMKIKKQEMLIEEIQKVGVNRMHANSQHNYDSTWTNASQTFYRLYKDGERINRQRQRSQHKCQFSFKPKLTQISQQMESKVQKKRQKQPLHTKSSKKSRDISMKVLQIYREQSNNSLNGTKKSLFSKSPFQNFMKRNQNLLNKREQTHKKKQFYDKQRQSMQKKQCTFSPVLNQKSRQLFLKMRQQQENKEDTENQQMQQLQLFKQENQEHFQDIVLEKQNEQKQPNYQYQPIQSEIKHYKHCQNFPYFASPSNQPKQSAIQSNSVLEMSSSNKKILFNQESQTQHNSKQRQWQRQFDDVIQQLMKGMIIN